MVWLWILLSLIVLFWGVLYGAFFYAFRKNRSSMIEERSAPPGKTYEPHAEKILKGIDVVLSHEHEDVYITSADGLRLHAKYYHQADGAPLTIFMHGYRGGALRDGNGAFIMSWRRGYNVLMVDQRAHGQSEGKVMTFGIKERFDCLRWIQYTNERFGQKIPIVLMGISMGASTVMLASALDLPKNVKCVLADCGFSSPKEIIQSVIRSIGLPVALAYPVVRLSGRIFAGIDIEDEDASCVEAVRNSKVPILFIHGDGDDFVPCHMSQTCYEACGQQKRILLVKGAGHGLSHCVDKVSYEAAVEEFLDSAMEKEKQVRLDSGDEVFNPMNYE